MSASNNFITKPVLSTVLVVPVFYVVMKTLIGGSNSQTGEDTSGVMS